MPPPTEQVRTAPPVEVRRRQQRDDACRAILDATESILVDEGYERFSMRKLAARCGYTAPTIYHYFGDKPGLFDALLELRGAGLVAELEAERLGPDPVENMRVLCSSFARFGLRNPAHYRLMMTPRPNAEPLVSGERAQALLQTPIQCLHAEGRLVFDDLDTAIQAFWGLLHGLISLHHSRPDVEWKDDIVSNALDALIRGSLRTPDGCASGS